MKAKSKILLALAFLTAGTIAAASTSTFAWFTTTRSATLTFTSVTVQNSAASLEAKLYPLVSTKGDNESITYSWGEANTTLSSSLNMSEISSGDGVKFVKPIWKTTVDGEISSHTAGTCGKDYTYFLLEVSNKAAAGSPNLNVYFDKGTGIIATGSDKDPKTNDEHDDAAAIYSRAAVNHLGVSESVPGASLATGATSRLVFENGEGMIGSTTVSPTTGVYVDVNVNESNKTYTKDKAIGGNYIVGAFDTVTRDSVPGNVAKQLVVSNLQPQKKFYSVVSVWLEGTKGNGANFDKTVGGSIDIKLQLAAFEA